MINKFHPSIAKKSWLPNLAFGALTASLLAINGFDVQAVILGPYTPDANTLHLWHLDESAVPAVDSAPSGTSLTKLGGTASLGNPSLSGFGNALGTGTSGTASYLGPLTYTGSTTDNTHMTYANTTTGAFTLEALVQVNFNPSANQSGVFYYLITAENQSGQDRPFQWALFPKGVASGATGDDTTQVRLRFDAGSSAAPNNIIVFVPSTGPDAIVQGNWYHVAVTFSGGTSSGTLMQYWTLMDASRVQANLLSGPGGATGQTMAVLNPKATGSPCFMLGNQGRSLTGNSLGLIDEVRLSQIARSPTDMMFGSGGVGVAILNSPISQVVDVGYPVSFSVSATGTSPLLYQWRTNSVAIPGATNSSYSIAAAQLSDALSYDVVVSNNISPQTSSPAMLTVRLPLALTWLGSTDTNWNNLPASIDWDSNSDAVADSAFGDGDSVTFNDLGSAAATVNLSSGPRSPQSVTFSANSTTYVLMGSGITGSGGLTVAGSSTVVLDNVGNSYSGPTVIQSGTLQIGTNDGNGSLGLGAITNQATLDFDTTTTLVLSNSIGGNGNLINDNTGNIELLGSNTFSGSITLNKGTLVVGPNGLGSSTNIVANGFGVGNGTVLALTGGVTISSNATFSCLAGPFDNRVTLMNLDSTNICNGSLFLNGASSVVLNIAGGLLQVNTPVVTGPGYSDYFTLRGGGIGILNSQVLLPNGNMQKTDGGNWTIFGANSSYLTFRALGGTTKLGNDNALATNAALVSGGGTLDLAGFSQIMSGMSDFSSGQTIITNSSATSDSIFTVVEANFATVNNTRLADAGATGGHKLSFTLDGGGSVAFGTTNTHTGITTIKSGSSLILNVKGSITASTIDITGNSSLDASYRTDGTLTLGTNQVLEGDGAFNVYGNLTNTVGTIELKLNKSGATLANDSINGSTAIAYGGTLKLDITASPGLTTNDTFKLFNAVSYAGAFATIIPPVPSLSLAWDTSTLAVDGTLRIAASTVALNPTNILAVLTNGGQALQITWPLDHAGYRLQAQTNSVNGTNWVTVPGSAMTNLINVPMSLSNTAVFYRLVYP